MTMMMKQPQLSTK